MKVLILQVSLCSTVEWFATFALLRFKEYLHQFCFAQFANKALSNTYFAILALLELCKIICFPSLCSGTKYISTARSARCANKVHFRFNFYGHGELCLHSAFTTRWIKKYIIRSFMTWWTKLIYWKTFDKMRYLLQSTLLMLLLKGFLEKPLLGQDLDSTIICIIAKEIQMALLTWTNIFWLW